MAKKKSFFASLSLRIAAHSVRTGLTASVIIHALVLAIQFTMPMAPPTRSNNLAVILVNAASATAPAPEDVQALAQVKSDGGGNTDEEVIVASPLPRQSSEQKGDNLLERHRGDQTRQPQSPPKQTEIITGSDNSATVVKVQPSPPAVAPVPPSPNARDQYDARQAEIDLAASIEAATQKYNQRPRRVSIGARTDEDRFARYVDAWRTKTESVGNSFPLRLEHDIKGRNLLMTVSVRKDGSVEKIVINRSSGYQALDETARQIVHQSAPYDVFPSEINDTDVIDITRTWRFTGRKLQAMIDRR
ncbi:MAG: TonB family protein [Azoarcus sp.]|jgi:protein TonB|nr:TonB family protein [Azoarcus sp.]